MRIIAGEARSRKLKTRKGFETRPTLANVKEALFSIIAPHLEESIFLDLFSGSGNIALEALSRGAKRAVMIEKDAEALRFIIENVNTLGYQDRCRAYKNDVFRAIEILARKGEKFNIIFMDPPYHQELEREVLHYLKDSELVYEDTVIIVEAAKDTDFSYIEDFGYAVIKTKEYKTNKHVFLERAGKEEIC